MLVYQAVAAAELFTGEKINDSFCENVMEEMYHNFQNIVLIGMPGSGKSTIGKAVAAQMKRECIDIDDRVEKREGISIPEIFAQHGEATFRSLEHACVAESSKSSGIVIATGGGTVLDRDNMQALKRNGRIYYLNRDIDRLPTKGRPLSEGGHALQEMYNLRHPLYLDYSDVRIDCNSTLEHVAQAIEEDFYETSGN